MLLHRVTLMWRRPAGAGRRGRRAQSAPHYLGIIKAGKTTARRYARPNDFYGVCNIAGT